MKAFTMSAIIWPTGSRPSVDPVYITRNTQNISTSATTAMMVMARYFGNWFTQIPVRNCLGYRVQPGVRSFFGVDPVI